MIQSWREMPIGILQEINVISQLHISDDEKTFKVTALLNGMDYDDFLSLPLDDARELVAKTDWVRTEPKKVKVRKEYQINGRDYYLNKNILGITTAAYIDFQAICQSRMEDNLPEMMAIVLIPKGHKYGDGYDQEEVVEEIRNHFNVEDALSVADFFITKCEKSMRRTLMKLEAMMTAQRIMARKEDKELMKALETEMKAADRELLSAYGYSWRRQWPK